jgi:hypothetical protein
VAAQVGFERGEDGQAGPALSASPTATARLSRGMGVSVSAGLLVVPLDDLDPVGLLGATRVGVEGRDRGLGLALAEPVADLDTLGGQRRTSMADRALS